MRAVALYWRALEKGIETATTPEERAWFEVDLRLREKLTLRDIGVWSHYPGDASQPLHVSVHYNGWGDFPNPNGYTTKKIHAYFEGEFVKANLSRSAVADGVRPFEACNCAVEDLTRLLLGASLAPGRGPVRAREGRRLQEGRTSRHRLFHGAACRRRPPSPAT